MCEIWRLRLLSAEQHTCWAALTSPYRHASSWCSTLSNDRSLPRPGRRLRAEGARRDGFAICASRPQTGSAATRAGSRRRGIGPAAMAAGAFIPAAPPEPRVPVMNPVPANRSCVLSGARLPSCLDVFRPTELLHFYCALFLPLTTAFSFLNPPVTFRVYLTPFNV